MKFALESPDMYDLMFNLKAPLGYLEPGHHEQWNEGKATFDVLRKTVGQCMLQGHFKGHQPDPLAFTTWGTVHGIASLHISQRIKGVNFENPESMVLPAYEDFILLLDEP